jgi:tetratricopeptide (TPR) repeat protein
MIVKDEEQLLPRALASVAGADEVVIVDTGSTDGTVAMAEAAGAKVYRGPAFAWRDDFAFSRNQSLARCTGDVVLIIDADEVLEPGGLDHLRAHLATTAHPALLFDTVSERGGEWHRSIRAFQRRPDITWRRRIHNYLTTTDAEFTDVRITYGYSPAHAKDPDRALRILTAVCAEEPTCVREKYYLAREHWYRRAYPAAIAWYDAYLAVATWGPEIADAHLMRARCLWALHRGEEARGACLQALAVNANFSEAFRFLAAMSGPKNRARWEAVAATASDADVLFVRPQPAPVVQDAAYYDRLFGAGYDTGRYAALYEAVAAYAGGGSVLDVGCGTAALEAYVVGRYAGFDFAAQTIERLVRERRLNVWVGAVATPADYGQADVYACLEVLEHVADDRAVVAAWPAGQRVALTVPSFPDPGHVRTFTDATARARYADLLEDLAVQPFALQDGVWRAVPTAGAPCIWLITGRRRAA